MTGLCSLPPSLGDCLAKKGYFIMHQKYLKSCKHPFLKGASFGLLTYDIVLLLDPFLKEKIFFLISVAHICSKLSLCLFIALHTCHHAFYDSTLVTAYFPSDKLLLLGVSLKFFLWIVNTLFRLHPFTLDFLFAQKDFL